VDAPGGVTRTTGGAWLPALALTLNAFTWGVSWWPFRQLQDAGLHPLWATALIYGVAVLAITLWRPGAWGQLWRTRTLWVLVLAAGTTNATFNWAVTIGDVVRVVNAPFRVETLPPVEELPLWKQPWVIDLARSAAAPAALALVACVIVFSLIRPAMTAVMTPPPAPPGSQLTATVGDDAALPGQADQRPDALVLGAPRPNERLDAVRNLAKENPAAVAQIVRGWVNGEPA
jgi:hypothetical protein